MADGGLVRRTTISATGEGIDNTTASVNALDDALRNTANATTGWGNAIDGLGGNTTVSIPISIDATGADAAALSRVQNQLAQLQASLPSTIVATVRRRDRGIMCNH